MQSTESARVGGIELPLTALVAALSTIGVLTTAGPRFYPDDPLWVDDDKALDASAVVPIEDANSYDFVVNTFVEPGERRDVRAGNVNTLDEVPDSSWFTNRIGRRAMSLDELRRGPDRLDSISLDGWVVSAGKGTGVQPGFRMTNPEGQTYQIEFDPPSNPEMATGAEIIGTAFYHAFGYHTVEVYLAELDPNRIDDFRKGAASSMRALASGAGSRGRDVDDVLRRGAKQPNGKYRVLASRFADGKPLGNFRYYGTRPDDPNDIVPHEHRRELRGARVFGAWLNHDDSRGVNSLDMLDDGTEPPLREALHVRLRIDHGQRHGLRAAASGRKRVHLRMEAGLAHPGDAGDLHAALDAHRLSGGAALGRPLRGRGVRPGEVEAGVSQSGLRQHAGRRCVLGGADRVALRRPRRFARSSRKRGSAIRARRTT